MTDDIIEAAARELEVAQPLFHDYEVYLLAKNIISAVTPLILEQAAKVAEEEAKDTGSYGATLMAEHIAAAIRSLKEQP